MTEKFLGTNGQVYNLDEDTVDVGSIPAESLSMKTRTYGDNSIKFSIPPSFFPVYFRGMRCDIKTGYGQFFDELSGQHKLQLEADQMSRLPFECHMVQNQKNCDVSYLVTIYSHGQKHPTLFTYDSTHPQYEIKAKLLSSKIDRYRAGNHSYSETEPCFIHSWTRDMTILKCAVQLCYWFDDYYRNNLRESNYTNRVADRSVDEIIRDIDQNLGRDNRGLLRRLFS